MMTCVLSSTYILISLVLWSAKTFYTRALYAEIKGNRTGLNGEKGTEIECSYTKQNVISIISVSFFALNKSSHKFNEIALYIPNSFPYLTDDGQYLKGRVTLMNITQSTTKAVMTINKPMCIDDTLYQCKVIYFSSTGVNNVISNKTAISVQVPLSAPEAVTLMNLSMSTTSIITDGDTISFVCSGDVGKPPGIFRFQHFRSDHILFKNFTSTSTSISEISDNCSYYRTSYITFMVTAEDNQAVIRCVVESPLSEISMYVDSEPLEVYYAVKMPTIVKLTTKTDYLVGIDTSINLKCNTNGNPKPSYVWYTDNTVDALSTSENLTITDASTTNCCIYTCFVSNALNGVIYAKRVQMHVCKREGSENTAVIVLGTVCGSIILVLCVVLFGVIHNKIMSLRIRNLNDRSLDYVNTIQQQDLSLYESVGHALEVRHYDQPSTGEHQYTNTNLSGSVGRPLDVHHYEQPSTGEHQYTNTNLSGN